MGSTTVWVGVLNAIVIAAPAMTPATHKMMTTRARMLT